MEKRIIENLILANGFRYAVDWLRVHFNYSEKKAYSTVKEVYDSLPGATPKTSTVEYTHKWYKSRR